MHNKHARRNRFLLALFFGTLSILFGASAASAAGGQPSGLTYVGAGTANNGRDVFVAYRVTDTATSYIPGHDYGVACMAHPVMDGFDYNTEPSDGGIDGDGTGPCPAGQYVILDASPSAAFYYGWQPTVAPTNSDDPLNGAGFKLVGDTVNVFTTYIVPAVVLLLIIGQALKLITRLTWRHLDRV